MKQLVQHLRDGRAEVIDVPCPAIRPGHVQIRTRISAISSGTERMMVEFGKASLLGKARQQPERIRQALDKVRTDGVLPALEAVRAKLDRALALGYCNAGVVLATGDDVLEFAAGDRVACNGCHAEVVQVPKNICARIPDGVSDESAAFAVLSAISMQGVRLASPTLGECFVVSGLGLVGLLAVQILRANGCHVLGIDFSADRLALARRFGADTLNLSQDEDPGPAAMRFSRGRGVDGVIIAAATASSEPIHQAAQICRKRGRIVSIGATGLQLSRADFYEKELTFQVSCSYGPGRYDPQYELEGHDYPVGFVRWTEQRNLEAALDLMSQGALDPQPLISHRFDLDEIAGAYELIGSTRRSLGVLIRYPTEAHRSSESMRAVSVPLAPPAGSAIRGTSRPVVGFIGAGGFASQVLIPAVACLGVRLKTIASANGLSAAQAGRKFGFEQATASSFQLLDDPEVNAVFIATRHDSHAKLVCDALEAGKHVFVEKPLAITEGQLESVEEAYRRYAVNRRLVLMAGFNRRFAPQVRKIKSLLAAVGEPKSFVMTVNAPAIAPDHWTQDPAIGGGRIIGEGCHFIDLLRFLAGRPVLDVQTTAIPDRDHPGAPSERVSFTLRFADGSFGTVLYLSNGHRSFSKERLEIFVAGRILQLDNFRRLRGYGWPGFRRMNLWRQDKGHKAEVAAFLESVASGGPAPIPFDELVETTKVSLTVARCGQSIGESSYSSSE